MKQRLTRRCWLLAGVIAPFAIALSLQPLAVRIDANVIRISAPQLHFLTGRPLERLKDGASVGFISQLSLSFESNGSIQKRALERFVISYDLWEEKFSVTRRGHSPRSASNLAASAAEAWCLDNMALDISGIGPDKPVWIRVEVRAADPKDEGGVVGEPGINLTRLIEIFSRAPRAQEAPLVLESGPLRLSDLKVRGSRGG